MSIRMYNDDDHGDNDDDDRGEEMFEFGVMACLRWTTRVPTNCGEPRGLLPSGS